MLWWLSEKYGRDAVADGFASVNADELRRFVPSGKLSDRLLFGSLEIITRAGIYLSGADGRETLLDQPASVQIRFKNRLLAAAKGYRLGADFAQFDVYIENWNGMSGCAVRRWTLMFVGERLLLHGEHWRSTKDGELCARGNGRQYSAAQ